ncbi:unnamed protein product [Bemisia tabaci]|uniref:Ubiquitin carboxyl-terminal hydrolase n=2 Tax=Bemisia tabaci TaxID=7038 RepID=A0A9P0C5Y3_BEMTA|nr:PREDICTED: ubiquitin carboxyl-terminal hydrolase isozyme L3 [Bemisia tabaci]CAH0773300.1 unnamed protein product [Bemisia tabaci]
MAWLPLESNPTVMNKFMQSLGVPDTVQIVDVYGIDPDLLAVVPRPVLALIMLFPCSDKHSEYKTEQEKEIVKKGQTVSENLFFLKQYVHNACGTIALIHSLANNQERVTIKDGYLKEFLDQAKDLNPEDRGHLLQKSEGIINTHKDIAVEGQTEAPDPTDPVPYHFIALVEKEGSLYELDGRMSFPVNHGPSSPDTILEDAVKVAKTYMDRDPNNLHFTLVALTMDS